MTRRTILFIHLSLPVTGVPSEVTKRPLPSVLEDEKFYDHA